jgi:hypothetical protein
MFRQAPLPGVSGLKLILTLTTGLVQMQENCDVFFIVVWSEQWGRNLYKEK